MNDVRQFLSAIFEGVSEVRARQTKQEKEDKQRKEEFAALQRGYEEHMKPVIDVLDTLPPNGGKIFHTWVSDHHNPPWIIVQVKYATPADIEEYRMPGDAKIGENGFERAVPQIELWLDNKQSRSVFHPM